MTEADIAAVVDRCRAADVPVKWIGAGGGDRIVIGESIDVALADRAGSMGEPVAGCVRHRGHALIDAAVDRAAQILRDGGLVAFPTETVYGLGADASSREALRRLYAVKGRPSAHPVIVHLASASQLEDWAVDVPTSARALTEAFWPGPLTMVLRRAPHVLEEVAGDGTRWACECRTRRWPSHCSKRSAGASQLRPRTGSGM